MAGLALKWISQVLGLGVRGVFLTGLGREAAEAEQLLWDCCGFDSE